MKKSHIEELKFLKDWSQEQPLSFCLNTKEVLRLEYLKSLRKIIKLKNSNRILCAKRNKLMGLHVKYDKLFAHIYISDKISEISEEIGKNTYKIQKLRTEYKQLESKHSKE